MSADPRCRPDPHPPGVGADRGAGDRTLTTSPAVIGDWPDRAAAASPPPAAAPPNPTGTDPTAPDPTGTDPTGTDPTGTDPAATDWGGSGETILTNARLVLPDRVIDRGTLVMRNGLIADLDEGSPSRVARALDLDGALVIPGLIDLHTDALEQALEPRPGVHWPDPLAAVIAHDTRMVGAGITTVFDAVAIGAAPEKGFRRLILDDSLTAIRRAHAGGVLRADHRIHLRCEVADGTVVERVAPHLANPLVGLVSVMDHTPGQRQWTDLAAYVRHARGEHWTQSELHARLAALAEDHALYAHEHRRRIVALVRARGLPLASHDDATPAHVEEAARDGATLCEFPVTLAAAQEARRRGLAILMGAPNVVRGGSHAGNVAALDLAAAGLLDGLCSDYAPASLLHAAFLLHSRAGLALPAAVASVSAVPAARLGLADRGAIACGRRADLVQVRRLDGLPIVQAVWTHGRRVF